MNKKPEPSRFRKFITRLLNSLLNRRCYACIYWRSFHFLGGTGFCARIPFHPSDDACSWWPACEYFDKGGAK